MKYENLKQCATIHYLASLVGLLCLSLLYTACNKDDSGFDPNASLYSIVDIGDFELLQESIDQMPYQGKDSVTFVDRDQKRLVFKIRETFIDGTNVSIEAFNVNVPRDTVVYRYGSQSKIIYLTNDSLGLRFSLHLSAESLDYDLNNPTVVDRLLGWVYFNGASLGKNILTHVTNQRDYVGNLNPGVYEDIELFGREFKDVYHNRFSNPASFVRFNYEFGIISFTDEENTVWVYQE